MTQPEEEKIPSEEEERRQSEVRSKDKEEEGASHSGETRDDDDAGELVDSQHASPEQKPPNILVKVFRSIGRTKDYIFVNAAEKGDVKTLKHYLEDKKYDPNRPKPDMQSWTALMHACKLGHVDVVKLLLEHGADPNIVAENGFSALILASKEGHYEVVRTLLDNADKPDVHAVNHGGRWGALMWACQKKGSKCYSEENLKENHYKIAKALIEAGANINQEAENGWTPLMQASQDNNIKIVKMLCEMEGIKLNHKSQSTWSALTTACRNEREEVTKVLVDAGADITLTKEGGITALHIACYKGLIKAMKHMVPPGKRNDSRIDINVKDEWDMTPLMLAIKGGHKELTEYLVKEVRAEVNIRAMKYNQWSAIFFAIRNKDLDTYHLLVDHGAKTDIKDEYENTFLDVARLSCSDVLKKTFYKQLEAEERKRLEVVQSQTVSTFIQQQKPTAALTLLDSVRLRYYPKDIAWRNQQRPLLISHQ